MAILGNLIKGFINVKETLTPQPHPVEEQREVLIKMLEKAKDTAFGKHYDFTGLLKEENIPAAFAHRVPFFDYNRIENEWWHRLHEGEEGVTWPGKPHYFALSSGTTGNTSKRIPVTNDMLEAIRDTGLHQIFALSNFDLPADFFEKEIMMLGSSTNLIKREDHLEGEISGISASNIPFWFRGFYKPGEEIARIDDWDERIQKIAETAKSWDIGALSGIPSWVELMLKKVIEYHQADHIHQIWPNLQVFTSGGVAFEPYGKSFNALLGKPVTIIDTYLASEGFLAYQSRPDTMSMQLSTDSGIYFEFVPFLPEYINEDGSLNEKAPVLDLSKVKTGEDYVLIITTVAGAWRYMIGDTIQFTDLERAEIRISGRTKFFLNTVGSQLSVNKMNDAMQYLEDEFDLEIPEFTVCAKRFDDGFYHSWYLGTEGKADTQQLAKALDEFLMEVNKNYKVARSKALLGVKVNLLPPDVFYEWNARNKKKGGQVKMERVMGEEKFREWEAFTSEINIEK